MTYFWLLQTYVSYAKAVLVIIIVELMEMLWPSALDNFLYDYE